MSPRVLIADKLSPAALEIFKSRGVAAAEIAVDVAVRQAGVLKRALGGFGVDLRDRFIRRLARRVFVGTDDIGFVSDGHVIW